LEKKDQGNRCLANKTGADDGRALRRYEAGLSVLEAVLPPRAKVGAGAAAAQAATGSAGKGGGGPLASEEERPRVEEVLVALRLNAAQAELRRSKWREAASLCGEVLSASPGNVKAHYRRGLARTELGDLSGAVEDFRAAAAAGPADAGIRRELARVEALQKQHRAEMKSAFGGVFDKMTQKDKEREEKEEARRKAEAEKQAEEERRAAQEASAQEAAQRREEAERRRREAAEKEAAKKAAEEQAPRAEEAQEKKKNKEDEVKQPKPQEAKSVTWAPFAQPSGGSAPVAAAPEKALSAQEECDAKAQELVESLRREGKIGPGVQQIQTVENPPPVEYEVPSFLRGGAKKKKSKEKPPT